MVTSLGRSTSMLRSSESFSRNSCSSDGQLTSSDSPLSSAVSELTYFGAAGTIGCYFACAVGGSTAFYHFDFFGAVKVSETSAAVGFTATAGGSGGFCFFCISAFLSSSSSEFRFIFIAMSFARTLRICCLRMSSYSVYGRVSGRLSERRIGSRDRLRLRLRVSTSR